MNTYVFDYLDENDFRKKEKFVRKYDMFAYKKLISTYYPVLRKGSFIGKEVSKNEKNKTVSYELQLPTDELFKKIHGPIILHYTVCHEINTILLTNITPEDILDEGHRTELSTYKGVMISKTNPEKDLFKINLLNWLSKAEEEKQTEKINKIIELNKKIEKIKIEQHIKLNKLRQEKIRIENEIENTQIELNKTFIFKKDFLNSKIDLLKQEYNQYEENIKQLNKDYKDKIEKEELKIEELKKD